MSELTANASDSKIEGMPDYTVSPYDAYQDTLLAYLITKCPGLVGFFGPDVTPYFSARFPKRLRDKQLAELTRP